MTAVMILVTLAMGTEVSYEVAPRMPTPSHEDGRLADVAGKGSVGAASGEPGRLGHERDERGQLDRRTGCRVLGSLEAPKARRAGA